MYFMMTTKLTDIGPHSAKLSAIYIKVACLLSECQGALKNIFLALLFDNQDINDLTNERVFRKFIQKINYLQSTGIDVVINEQTYRVYFTIGLVVADNLAMHALLGFVESYSSNYLCRFCRIDKRIMHFQCEEDPGLFRDKVQHELDCFEANVKNSGVNGRLVLNCIDHFEPTANPSADIMHDIFEGVCIYDMQHVLYDLIFIKKYFTTETLNFRIIAFNYGSSISNKPVQFIKHSVEENV